MYRIEVTSTVNDASLSVQFIAMAPIFSLHAKMSATLVLQLGAISNAG
jgi:hypothetical protein